MSEDTRDGGGPEGPLPEPVSGFLEDFLTGLVGALEATLGADGARAFVATAAEIAGETHLPEGYGGALGEGLAEAMTRIGGGFRVAEASGDAIVLVNSRCPFGAGVEGIEAHCALTETVVGQVAARRMGYASVELEETIARGHGRCVVIVHLARGKAGRVYRS